MRWPDATLALALAGRRSAGSPRRRLSLFGRSVLLIGCELLASLLAWAIALGVFLRTADDEGSALPLCLIAWTLGLRHGLDADHISAIDNVLRRLIALGQRPVTVGLFFSLGHSTIVIAVTIAIVVSASVLNHLDALGDVGGVVGVSISASFLLIIAVINSIILYRAIQTRRHERDEQAVESCGDKDEPPTPGKLEGDAGPISDVAELRRCDDASTQPAGLITRLCRPLLRLIDRPYKMYLIGLCFGLGFDTASSIALLGVTALAGRRTTLPSASLLVLPALFTAGMTLVDSLDTIAMLWGYAAADPRPGGGRWRVFESAGTAQSAADAERDQRADPTRATTTISLILTTISIVVAFAISLIEFMGLAADQCASCADSAENDGGLSGRWWRFWIALNDNSGYVGAGIVGAFMLTIGGWYGGRWLRRRRARRAEPAARN